tara:strand:- start:1135 stop:1788 length:654 start_codon:yes stop_codon:yes gene_type:complete
MTILSDLHSAADRAEIVNRRGASPKQIEFLASLMEQCGKDARDIGCECTQSNAVLTSKQASRYIGDYLDDVKALPPKTKPTSTVGNLRGIVQMLEAANGTIKHPKISFENADLRLSLAGNRAKFPGSISVTSNAGYGENEWYGRILADGTYQPSAKTTDEVQDFLTNLCNDPVSAVSEHGHKTGNCCFCSLPLETEASTTAGYGPVCAQGYGLPWGS